MNRRGLSEVIYQAYVPGGNNYAAEMAELHPAGIDVLYIGGYPTEIALMHVRQATAATRFSWWRVTA